MDSEPRVTEVDREAAARFYAAQTFGKSKTEILADWAELEASEDGYCNPLCLLFASHRQAALIEGARVGLEAAAQMATEWREENKAAADRDRKHGSLDMWRRFEGAATECNAIAHELGKTDPATIIAQYMEKQG